MKLFSAVFAVFAGALIGASPLQADTFDDVVERGYLICGVGFSPGFATVDDVGNFTGFDVDICRAVAAAVLGDADKVAFKQLTTKERFTALQSGQVDLLSRTTTWTFTRDVAMEVNFATVTFYTGQGVMVRADLGIGSIDEMDGAKFCISIGTTSEPNLRDYFRANDMELRLEFRDTAEQVIAAYQREECDAYSNDASGLGAFRSGMADPEAHVILPELISKEPLGPAVRHGDDRWLDIVKWTVFALIQAEESGITSENVEALKASQDRGVRNLLGFSGHVELGAGLPEGWLYEVIRQVGNYGEIYERNVGPQTPRGLPRGLNALWTDGGLMYAMPFR